MQQRRFTANGLLYEQLRASLTSKWSKPIGYKYILNEELLKQVYGVDY